MHLHINNTMYIYYIMFRLKHRVVRSEIPSRRKIHRVIIARIQYIEDTHWSTPCSDSKTTKKKGRVTFE